MLVRIEVLIGALVPPPPGHMLTLEPRLQARQIGLGDRPELDHARAT